MEDLFDFQKGQIVGATVTETAKLLGISKIMRAYEKEGKTCSAKHKSVCLKGTEEH